MTNAIKGLVSKKKKRYKDGEFNLDLSYIRDDIIAMGYPAKNFEGLYRNHIDDVKSFLAENHNNNNKIYNLCGEKKYQYDSNTFQQCASFPFYDHNPPSIELIQSFCNDVQKWLSEDVKNVAAIHCKAGKGRTGTMICCYLLHIGQFDNAADALLCYDQKRTTNSKGVTIPSQRRYVEYYAQVMKLVNPYTKIAMNVCEVRIFNLPYPSMMRAYGTISYSIFVEGKKIHHESLTDLDKKRVDKCISIKLDRCIFLYGDVKIEFMSTLMKHKSKLFHYWFNTFFINEIQNSGPDDGTVILVLNKHEIDGAHKDKSKIFPEDFRVETIFQRIPQTTNSISRSNNSNGINHHHINSRNNHINNNDCDQQFMTQTIPGLPNNHRYSNQQSQSTDSTTVRRNIATTTGPRCVSLGKDFHRGDANDLHSSHEESTSPEESSSESSSDWESESLVRYRLLSEPELSSLLKTMSNCSIKSSPNCQHKVMKKSSTHNDDADNDNNATSIESNNTEESCSVKMVEQRCPVVVNRLSTTAAESSHNENHNNNNNSVRAEEK